MLALAAVFEGMTLLTQIIALGFDYMHSEKPEYRSSVGVEASEALGIALQKMAAAGTLENLAWTLASSGYYACLES